MEENRNLSDKPAELERPDLPLHRRVYTHLRREIARRYKAGDVLPSQNVLARELKVSFPTVREALCALAEEGVIQRRRGRDTIVLDPQAGQRIAILLEQDIAHPRISFFFRCLPHELRNRLRERGLRAQIYSGAASPVANNAALFARAPSTCPEFLEDCEAGRIFAVAVLGGISTEMLRILRHRKIPMVGQDPRFEHRVYVDTDAVVRRGLDYLADHGRRELAVMSWGSPGVIIRHARERGIHLRLDHIRCDLPPATPEAGWNEFRDLWAADNPKPDGLLITDGVLFGDALHAMLEARVQVPEELMVVTHDTAGSPFWSPFPVVRLQVNVGAVAAETERLLLALLENRDLPPTQIAVPPVLIES